MLLTSRPERETTTDSTGVGITSQVQAGYAKRRCEGRRANIIWLKLLNPDNPCAGQSWTDTPREVNRDSVDTAHERQRRDTATRYQTELRAYHRDHENQSSVRAKGVLMIIKHLPSRLTEHITPGQLQRLVLPAVKRRLGSAILGAAIPGFGVCASFHRWLSTRPDIGATGPPTHTLRLEILVVSGAGAKV
jgi:hypothetical protein